MARHSTRTTIQADLQDTPHALLARGRILPDDSNKRFDLIGKLLQCRFNRTYSDFTFQVVQIFQGEHSLMPLDSVDEKTACALNEALRDFGLLDGSSEALARRVVACPCAPFTSASRAFCA